MRYAKQRNTMGKKQIEFVYYKLFVILKEEGEKKNHEEEELLIKLLGLCGCL